MVDIFVVSNFIVFFNAIKLIYKWYLFIYFIHKCQMAFDNEYEKQYTYR